MAKTDEIVWLRNELLRKDLELHEIRNDLMVRMGIKAGEIVSNEQSKPIGGYRSPSQTRADLERQARERINRIEQENNASNLRNTSSRDMGTQSEEPVVETGQPV